MVEVVGFHDWALRAPAFLAGVLLVPAVGWQVAQWTRSPWAGGVASLLVAFDRHCVFYSQEARPYAVLQLVAWCHLGIVWHRLQAPRWRWRLAFVVGAVVQFYLHYTAALLLLAEGLAVLWHGAWQDHHADDSKGGQAVTRHSQHSWRPWLTDALLIALACSPAGWQLFAIGARRDLWARFVSPPSIWQFLQTLQVDLYLVVPLLACGAAHVWQGVSQRPIVNKSEPEAGPATIEWLLAIALFVPALFASLATHTGWAALFLRRYFVGAVATAPALAACVLGRIQPGLLRTLVTAATIATALTVSGVAGMWWRDGRIHGDRRQDWRGAIAFIRSQAEGVEDHCWVRSGFVESDGLRSNPTAQLEDYCLAPVRGTYPLTIATRALPNTSPVDYFVAKSQRPSLPPDTRTWFLVNGTVATRENFQRELTRRCAAAGIPVRPESSRTFGDVLVLSIP